MELPRTLHAQLYLLAYDREHHRFGGTSSSARWFFEFALRSAMLTELYLAATWRTGTGRRTRYGARTTTIRCCTKP